MEKIRNSNLLKRTLVLVLCLALGAGILPVNDYSVKVEAADYTVPNYALYISKEEGGRDKLTPETTYEYTGYDDETVIYVDDPVTNTAPTDSTIGVDGAKLSINWVIDQKNVIEVVKGENTDMVTVKRLGPGLATLMCKLTWEKDGKVLLTKNVTTTIKIPITINKSSSTTDTEDKIGRKRDLFTKLNPNNLNEGNTVLMFNIDKDNLFLPEEGKPMPDKGKEVIFNHGTRSTSDTVKWESENQDIADITTVARKEEDLHNKMPDDIVTIIPKAAGTTKITATSQKTNTIKDSFHAVVMPIFSFGAEKSKKTIPEQTEPSEQKSYLENLKFVTVDGSANIQTNALRTKDLKWRVYQYVISGGIGELSKEIEENDKNAPLKIETRESAAAYIANNPKAGIYRITAQTKVPGKEDIIDKNLGVAEMYAKVPIKFQNGYNVVLGIGDTYNIMNNSNIQSTNDFEFNVDESANMEEPDYKEIIEINNATKIVKGKKNGLATATFCLKDDPAIYEKYGIIKDSLEYDKYVKNGIKFTFSVVDSFGINNSNITLAVKGTADLTVSTQSNNGITWESSDDSIVEVTNTQGKTATITGNNVGKAVITVTQEVDGVKKSATCIVTVVKSAEKITIDPPVVEMDVDETKMIKAILSPDNMLVGNLKWSSSDEKVVKIDSYNGQNATIKGVGDGVATITVINTDNAIIGTCKVTVHGKTSGITITPDKATVQLADKTLQLNAVVQPSTNVQPELTWMSSDTSIATVDNKGLVTLKDGGTVKITVFIKKNPAVSATATITIQRSVAGLKLDQSSKIMFAGEKYKLGYTLTPPDASNKNIKWTSAKPSVASVDKDGNILAISPGETIIMAQTEDGRYTDYCIVTVKQLAKNIKITTKDVFVNKGNKHKIEYTLEPANATDVSIQWESMNPKIATVDQKGEVTAVEVGSTTILAKVGGEVAYCNVTVIEKATGIKLNYSEKVVYKNKTFALKASIIPEGSTNRKVTFVSSKPSVATVTSSGTVKGIAPGTALITATTADGGHKAICVVTVKELTTSIKLNRTFYALGIKNKFTLVPKIQSNHATNKKVSFTSSNPSIATVNSKGQVTGKKLGYTNITVKALDGSGAKATCRVRVVVPTKSLKLNKTVMTMIVGRTTKLKPTFAPKNTSYKTVKWSSNNAKVVKVLDNGTVIALAPGSATITATAKDNGGKKKAICYVTVREAVPSNGINITNKNSVMVKGEKLRMSAVLTPYNSTDSITWASDNPGIASVGKTTGSVTAKSPGIASITAISSGGKINTTTVTVVGLDTKSITLEQYTNFMVSVIGAPTGVSWQSENPRIATVQNGRIITRSVGRTRIVANVRGRKLYCNVRVVPIR